MINQMIETIGQIYPLTAKDTKGYDGMKASGMKFSIRAYDAKGLGTVSVMQAQGFFGLMKMDTLIINPTEIDMPLLSYDRVLAMGNDTLIYELYDTFVEAHALPAVEAALAQGKDLPAHDVGSHWYDSIKLAVSVAKKGKKKDRDGFDALAFGYMQGFLADCGAAAACDAAAKRDKASTYVEGLLSHGGPSTDVFKKAIGDEKTAELFREVLFGTK